MPRPITYPLLLTAAALLMCLSCSRLGEMETRLDALEQRITTLESATEVLRALYDRGEIITAVTPLEDGYRLSFSDGHRLDIEDCVTPLLLIDRDGYWCISYDDGATYSRMQDSRGDDLAAGVSVRTTVDDEGYYVLEHYLQANPDSIVSTVSTFFPSSPDKIIASITEDSRVHTVTFTLADGESFAFSKAHTAPTGIALLTTQTLLVGRGDTVSLAFRVNPSTATFDYDPSSPSCQLFLDRIGDTRSYVSTPTDYALVKVVQAYDEQGVMKGGEYRAYIADRRRSGDYSDHIALVIRTTGTDGQPVEVSSPAAHLRYTDNTLRSFSFLREHNPTAVIADVQGTIDGQRIRVASPYITRPDSLVATFHSDGYKVYVDGVEQVSGLTAADYSRPVTCRVENEHGEATEYSVEVVHSGLPVMFVDTPSGMDITDKHNWYYGADIRLVGTDGTTLLTAGTAIKGRGNSSWNYPKKSYALKLDGAAPLLGMPEHRRWVLLANWMDRTLLRNRVAFRLGECTQMAYTPRSEYVELVLNGRHMGNYLLCEQIRIDENRVDIHPLTAGDTDLTGGYLMEIDRYYDEPHKFRSAVRDFPYMFKQPDEEVLTDTMLAYMQGYIDAMEHALYDDFASRRWAVYLDLGSFVDYWFAGELTSNDEYSHPKSTYMYKDRGGKLCAGPLWDNDYWTFMPRHSRQYILRRHLYYPALFEDAAFVSLVKERWPAAREQLQGVASFIDAEAERLRGSARLNITLWPITTRINEDETLSFGDAVERLKQTCTDKLQWLDGQITGM